MSAPIETRVRELRQRCLDLYRNDPHWANLALLKLHNADQLLDATAMLVHEVEDALNAR